MKINSMVGFNNLRFAICLDAVKQYKKYGSYRDNASDAELFIRSQWFTDLCGMDGSEVIRMIDERRGRKCGK